MATPFVTVKIDPLDEARILRKLSTLGRNSKAVLVNATNDTLKTAKTKSSTEIRKDISPRTETETPKAYVDRRLSIRNATTSNPSGVLSADKRGLLLTRFAATYVKSRGGVTVKVKPTGARKLIEGAFIVKNLKNSGTSGVAVRDSSKGSGIRLLYGPSVSQVFNTELPTIRAIVAPILVAKTAAEVNKFARGVGRYA